MRGAYSGLTSAVNGSDARWFSAVEASRWPEAVYRLLAGVGHCAARVDKGRSILVHCTDGWDRTPAVVSLTQARSGGQRRRGCGDAAR